MLTSVRLWGADVRLGQTTRFDGASLRKRFGAKWRAELRLTQAKDFYELRGYEEGDEAGAPLSWWATRFGQARGGAHESSSPHSALFLRAGRRPGSGIDVAVWHLRELEGVKEYTDVLRLLSSCGVSRFEETSKSWIALGTAGASERARAAFSRGGRAHRETDCEWCQSGLPPQLAVQLASRKRPVKD
jgi:hypothetical protein